MITTDIKISASFTKTIYTIDPVQTTNATPQIAISVPILNNQSAYAVCQFNCTNTAFTNSSGGSVSAVFMRAGGDVTRTNISTATGLIASILSNFLIVQPSIDMVATAATQTIDLKVTGTATTTINWHLELVVYTSNT